MPQSTRGIRNGSRMPLSSNAVLCHEVGLKVVKLLESVPYVISISIG